MLKECFHNRAFEAFQTTILHRDTPILSLMYATTLLQICGHLHWYGHVSIPPSFEPTNALHCVDSLCSVMGNKEIPPIGLQFRPTPDRARLKVIYLGRVRLMWILTGRSLPREFSDIHLVILFGEMWRSGTRLQVPSISFICGGVIISAFGGSWNKISKKISQRNLTNHTVLHPFLLQLHWYTKIHYLIEHSNNQYIINHECI